MGFTTETRSLSVDETTSSALSCDYQAAIQFLFGRIDYERTNKIPYGTRVFKLDRMHHFVELLGNPTKDIPIVHIAGTKGKGSTSEFLASIASEAGYRVGQYTSPHLDRLEERFSINRQHCSQQDIVDLITEIIPIVKQLDAEETEEGGPTFFEITTAMALLHFRNQKIDLGILEVGLGGRLDSTNVCDPLLTIITSISYDHTSLLGNSLAEIAAEKAGIIKPGIPLISGVTSEEAKPVIQSVATKHAAPVLTVNHDFETTIVQRKSTEEQNWPSSEKFHFHQPQNSSLIVYSDLSIRLKGKHQIQNAAVAIAATSVLNQHGFSISEDAIRKGIAKVQLPARIECLSQEPVVIVDSSHNDASAAALVDVLETHFGHKKRRLILALSNDKDHPRIIETLLPCFDEIWFTRYRSNPRNADPAKLFEIASELPTATNCQLHVQADTTAAFQAALQSTSSEDLLCVTGSFFIAGEFRKFYLER
ncbi:MAG: bifunctional folylpolyglutamate synthase/dihydrofolate synthase [Blastopirellula sp.]|nr:MAG: bifunctional folylpolyglutamate synthase/dihydrofolate synthase [Blastopirellula sp.]